MNALAARQHRKACQAEIGQRLVNIPCRLFDVAEIESFVGVKIEDHAVRLFERFNARSPAVKLDRPHLDTGQQPGNILDIEIILDAAVLFRDRHRLHMLPKTAGVVFLEETFLRPALRTAHQACRAMGRPGQHQRADSLVIIGKIALRRLGVGKYDAVPVRDSDHRLVLLRSGRCRTFRHDLARILVLAQSQKAAVPYPSVPGKFGEGDLGNQPGRDPVRIAALRFRYFCRRSLALKPLHLACQFLHGVFREAGSHAALVDQLSVLVLGEQQRGKRTAFLVRFAPANDDKFLSPRTFDLQPVSGASTAIGRVCAFRDNTLLSRLAHGIQQFFARTEEVIGKADPVIAFCQGNAQSFLALDIGQLRHVLAVPLEQIKGE